jgi:DNA-binding LacI/PurR family transcriptional regulator
VKASLTERELNLVAAEAGLDPRTVRRALNDRDVSPHRATRSSIARALRKYGHREIAEKLEGDRG